MLRHGAHQSTMRNLSAVADGPARRSPVLVWFLGNRYQAQGLLNTPRLRLSLNRFAAITSWSCITRALRGSLRLEVRRPEASVSRTHLRITSSTVTLPVHVDGLVMSAGIAYTPFTARVFNTP